MELRDEQGVLQRGQEEKIDILKRFHEKITEKEELDPEIQKEILQEAKLPKIAQADGDILEWRISLEEVGNVIDALPEKDPWS